MLKCPNTVENVLCDKRERLYTAPCIVCGGGAVCHKPQCNGYDIYVCGGCRLEFCRPMPGEETLAAFYRDYHDPRARKDVALANARRNITTLERFDLRRESRLLDYGSGQGAFCEAGGSESWRNYDAFTEDCDRSVLREGGYDWVTLWGVLEHVVDPLRLLRELGDYLRPGGFLALTTVSTEQPIPFQYKPPEHVSYWTEAALRKALAFAGFEVQVCRPYRMVQKNDVYLNAVLRTVPKEYRGRIAHALPEMVEVPTNEVFLVARKTENE